MSSPYNGNICVHLRSLSENPWITRGVICASDYDVHGIEKRIVYVLQSQVDPSRHYVGVTNDLAGRLERHNHGPSGHTVSWRPWRVVVSLAFRTERDAVRFEKYLKSGSGRAFAKRHFAPAGEPPDD